MKISSHVDVLTYKRFPLCGEIDQPPVNNVAKETMLQSFDIFCEQMTELVVIWDAMTLIWCQRDGLFLEIIPIWYL